MTDPSITNNSGVKFTWNKGDVHSIEPFINSNLDHDAMPGFTPNNSLLYDFNGVLKTIVISGELQNTGNNTLSSGTAITVDAQRKWLEQNLAGFQSGATFISNYSSTYNGSSWIDSKVLIASVRFNETTNQPNVLPFTITLFVGDV